MTSVNDECERCSGKLVEIDHYGERLTGCLKCNRWQAATGEWCRLAPDDIVALRALQRSKRVTQIQPEQDQARAGLRIFLKPPVLYGCKIDHQPRR
jgi:hypothetical protein